MKIIKKTEHQTFENIKQIDEKGNEFWYARTLSKILGYTDFRNFVKVIEKAKEACVNSGHDVLDHVVEVNEMVGIGSDIIYVSICKRLNNREV
jgi:DNA-damage-inducible protein D